MKVSLHTIYPQPHPLSTEVTTTANGVYSYGFFSMLEIYNRNTQIKKNFFKWILTILTVLQLPFSI